ncbi:MAG: pullulanase [Candidatus Riflebacteria bacterium]|nr:pullulanase [Candidatus Riflebacteria bacterium]
MKQRNWYVLFLGMYFLPLSFGLAAPLTIPDGKNVGNGFRQELPFYGKNDLGPAFTTNGVTLKIWSPNSMRVSVIFFDKSDQNKEVGRRDLTPTADGVWETTLDNGEMKLQTNLINSYYQYEITRNGKTNRVLDPYARSMAEFTASAADPVGKAALVNPASEGTVSGYARIAGYRKRTDAVIYEVHVRDFTSDPGLKTMAPFGTYPAFIEQLEYLKSLGVTHIQLLPVLSWYYGDESKSRVREMEYSVKNNNYNWGYDPHGYFSPDGMYSADPKNSGLRIKELKSLVEAIHQAGMGVILDVVFNHTAKPDLFENIVPGYFFRTTPDGRFTSNSGCGNDVATTNPMVRKLIIDSISYWTREYKVDGFRFDLMGLIDTETIAMAYVEASRANPDVLFLGEGWKMYNGPTGTEGADQNWMSKTDDVAVFSDSFRDVLKFGGFNEGVPAFLTGKPAPIRDIFNNLKGQPTNFAARSPANVVQYLEAHDGLTLHDTICCAVHLDPQRDKKEIFQRMKLGNLMLLTAQGIAFLQAGQEMARTKEWHGQGLPPGENKEGTPFIRNSYDSSDAINKFDWERLLTPEAMELKEFTRGLIQLRKSTDAFRLGEKDLIDANVMLLDSGGKASDDLAIAYSCRATTGRTYFVFVNADNVSRSFPIPGEALGAAVIVDARTAGATAIAEPSGLTRQGSTITVGPLTGIVLVR